MKDAIVLPCCSRPVCPTPIPEPIPDTQAIQLAASYKQSCDALSIEINKSHELSRNLLEQMDKLKKERDDALRSKLEVKEKELAALEAAPPPPVKKASIKQPVKKSSAGRWQ